MANYYATSRSNAFRVKDADAFKAWLDSTGANYEIVSFSENDPGFIVEGDDDSGDFPSWVQDPATADDVEIDWAAELPRFLKDGEVAVLMSVGAEKLRYVAGWALAVNSAGESVTVSLDDIYAAAVKQLGVDPHRLTQAIYSGTEPYESEKEADTVDY